MTAVDLNFRSGTSKALLNDKPHENKASWLINVYLMTAAVHLVLLAAEENGIFISKVLLMPELALLVWLNRGLVRTPCY